MSPNRFRELREQLGLTQKELAEILGLSSYLVVTHYEGGFRKPSALTIALMQILAELPEKKSLELREMLKIETAKAKLQKRKDR